MVDPSFQNNHNNNFQPLIKLLGHGLVQDYHLVPDILLELSDLANGCRDGEMKEIDSVVVYALYT